MATRKGENARINLDLVGKESSTRRSFPPKSKSTVGFAGKKQSAQPPSPTGTLDNNNGEEIDDREKEIDELLDMRAATPKARKKRILQLSNKKTT